MQKNPHPAWLITKIAGLSIASAAFAIEKLPQPIAGLPPEKIFQIKGIGESVGKKLIEILESFLREDGLQILIGSESDFTQVHNFSIVARRYGNQAAPLGMVGIIGPMRMEYARIAPLVDYLGRALSSKIEEEQERDQ